MLNHLINQLRNINNNFGKGDITEITLNMLESNPHQGEFYGTVTRVMPFAGSDVRMFKLIDRTLTFLSKKRKLDL